MYKHVQKCIWGPWGAWSPWGPMGPRPHPTAPPRPHGMWFRRQIFPSDCPCILSKGQNRVRGLRQRPPEVSIILEYVGMVLDCLCLALEAQLVQKSGKWAHHTIYMGSIVLFLWFYHIWECKIFGGGNSLLPPSKSKSDMFGWTCRSL